MRADIVKYLAIFFTALFIILAVSKLSYPDPVFWIALYGYGLMVSILAIGGRFNIFPIIVGLMIYLSLTIYHFYAQAQRLQPMGEGWEGVGLLACTAAMIVYLAGAYRQHKEQKQNKR
jgi:hypothetical protein